MAMSVTKWDKAPLQALPEAAFTGALEAFKRSCSKPLKLHAKLEGVLSHEPWQTACKRADYVTSADAKTFFTSHFTPYALARDDQMPGKMTGYYLPVIRGSLEKTDEFTVPVYGKPKDYRWPYFTRQQIDAGALNGKGAEIAWVDDKVMLFFIQVQGSGWMQLPDGSMAMLQFAAKNGREYRSIGKVLIERGELTRANVSLQTIRAWLYQNPERIDEILHHNDSYIFFTLNRSAQSPKGAQGVPLTANHSLAIDPAYLPYGLPVWVNSPPVNQLLITQDTGSAIKGALRGDVFFGAGSEAEQLAGAFNQPGEWVLLIPTKPDAQ